MALRQNIIYIYFKGKHQVTSKSQYQYNRKQYLYFADLNLPQVFEVHFSNRDKGESKTQIGSNNLVEIPDEYFWNGALQIYAWIYLHSETNDGETIYEVKIPLSKRAKPTDEEPLPVQQSAIDKAIAELNNAVNVTTENANKTDSDKIIVANIKDEVVDLKEDIDSTATIINQKTQETIDASGRAETSALNAADSERKALNYSQQAEQSAQSALESKNIAQQKSEVATNASNEALGYRNEALEAKNQAVQAKQNIVDYRDETKGFRDETLNLKNTVQTLKNQADEITEEIKDISDTVKEDAQSASQSASSASQSSINASQSASQAEKSANDAEESANQAEQNKSQTETFKNQSEDYKNQSETYKNQSETFKNQAEQFKNQSETNVTHYPKIIGEYWYVWDATNGEYINTNVDANGIKGDTGNGIASIALNNDYTLTITFTDDTTYTTSSIRGQQGEQGDTGATGESGVYIGSDEPENEDIKVWIDTDESTDNGTVEDLIADITELKEELTAVAENINSGDIMFQDGTFTELEKSLDWSTNTRKIQYVNANTEKHLIMSFSDVAGTKTVSCAFSQMSGFNTNGVRFSTTEYPFVVLRTKSNLPSEANSTFKFFFYRADGSSGFNFSVPIPTGDNLIVVDIKEYIRAHGDNPSVHTLVEPDGIRTASYTYTTAPKCEINFMGMFTKEQAEHYNLKKYVDGLNAVCNDYNFSKLNDYSCMSMFKTMGVVGDSWASGSVHTPDGYVDTVYDMSWGQMLGRKCGIAVSNYSSGGLTTKTWLTASAQYGSLAKLLSEDPKNLYLLNLGINDKSAINSGTEILGTVDDIKNDYTENPDTFYGNYGRIIGNIREHAPKAIIIMISMLPKLSRTMDEYIAEIAEKCEVPFIQVTDDEYFTSDYFYNANFEGHMCVLGYSGVANAIERLIQKYMVNHITDFAYYDGLTTSM